MTNFLVRKVARWVPLIRFKGSQYYWQTRYRLGGDSGAGSRGAAAAYKATVLNQFVAEHGARSIIEFGCGDGRQLELADYPSYVGVDISDDAVRLCRERFAADSGKHFISAKEYAGERAQVALSLDVLYHLVEDQIYETYLRCLFGAATDYVVIYSTDVCGVPGAMRHVRDRPISADVSDRFPEFVRMHGYEAGLPPPVEHDRGVTTKFFFYCRK